MVPIELPMADGHERREPLAQQRAQCALHLLRKFKSARSSALSSFHRSLFLKVIKFLIKKPLPSWKWLFGFLLLGDLIFEHVEFKLFGDIFDGVHGTDAVAGFVETW